MWSTSQQINSCWDDLLDQIVTLKKPCMELPRLGVRRYSTSALASRVVADFMAILAYVDYEKKGYVSSYASDPVLTLGAIKVWNAHGDALSKYILPRLKKLILNEALGTGGIGKVAARIVLLLAMDKCAMDNKSFMTSKFVAVPAFLKVLGASVSEMQVKVLGIHEAKRDVLNAYHTWLSSWKYWLMGFTHFVQMNVEPDENTLWYLLGRRAAGIFPRDQRGADLLIPIFREKSCDVETHDKADEVVSMMVVHVDNWFSVDRGFSTSRAKECCPSFGFEDQNTTSKKSIDGIHMYMNVQEEKTEHQRFIFAEHLGDKDQQYNDDNEAALSKEDKEAVGSKL